MLLFLERSNTPWICHVSPVRNSISTMNTALYPSPMDTFHRCSYEYVLFHTSEAGFPPSETQRSSMSPPSAVMCTPPAAADAFEAE